MGHQYFEIPACNKGRFEFLFEPYTKIPNSKKIKIMYFCT